MDLEIKVKGITKKWLYRFFPVFALVVILCELILGIALKSYYEDQVKNSVREYITNINVLSLSTKNNFSDNAIDYIEKFAYRDKIELQILDSNGHLIATTNGFASDSSDITQNYISALSSKSATAYYSGKNQNGESIFAGTTILPDLGYGSNGAYRWVVSMKSINRQLVYEMIIFFLIGLVILAIVFASGMFFINSIVKPIHEVSDTARKIAGGDLKARLDFRGTDEIGELCDSINYMASELQQAETLKNDFISSVSHELRTPLTAIKGWGETIRLSVRDDEEIVKKGIDIMLGETERLSGLVEELLDFSRVQTGRMEITTEPLKIRALLAEVVEMYAEICSQQGIELMLIKGGTDPTVLVDRNRIKQVFINIIDNAIKYTKKGGHIIVSTALEEGCVRVIVNDSGAGIPAKDVEHVKERFYKADKMVRGSGIGLAVADEIIKYHNGLLLIESTEGVGTTVTVVLPTYEPEEEITEKIFPPSQDIEISALQTSPAKSIVTAEEKSEKGKEDSRND